VEVGETLTVLAGYVAVEVPAHICHIPGNTLRTIEGGFKSEGGKTIDTERDEPAIFEITIRLSFVAIVAIPALMVASLLIFIGSNADRFILAATIAAEALS
jgi:hypothetical protein